MKKQIIGKYGICLIIGAVLLYVVLNIFYFFSVIYNNLEHSWLVQVILPGIFAMVTLCIFKWITEKDFQKIEQLQMDIEKDSSDLKEKVYIQSKKKYNFFWIVFSVYTLIFVVVGVNNIKFQENLWNTASNFFETYFQDETFETLKEFKEELNINFLKNVTLSLLPFVFIYFMFYKSFIVNKRNNKRWIKNFTRVISIIFVLVCILLSAYYIIDIPEFKYLYETTQKGIVVNGYSDLRDYYCSDYMKIPEKIKGKIVVDITNEPFLLCKNIYLSSKFPKNSIYGFVYMYLMNTEIHMYGEPIEWYEKDGVIYNLDGTEIVYINTENLYITENITEIYESSIYHANSLKSINVDENNKIFFDYDNVLYANVETVDNSGNKFLDTYALIPPYKDDENIILPSEIKGSVLYVTSLTNKKIFIPKEFNKLIEFIDTTSGFNLKFEVEEGNTTYEAYNGSLYTKGLEKVIALRKDYENTTIILPAELKEISEECLYDMVYMSTKNRDFKVEIDEKNPHFIVKDDLVYMQNGTNLIMPAKYMKTIKIDENVKEISELILDYYDECIEISDKNPYFVVGENGEINKIEEEK